MLAVWSCQCQADLWFNPDNCYIPPMPRDPYQRPMSLSESENLLRDADNWEATKAGWISGVGILALVVAAIAVGAGLFFGLAAAAGPAVAVVVTVLAVLYWHDRK
jgi:hypothetical protein